MIQEPLQRLHLMHANDLRSLLWDSARSFRGVQGDNIGAIISVEPSKADPAKPLEDWRVSPDDTTGISRHFTSVLYADPLWKKARTVSDPATTEDQHAVNQIVIQRISALSETLKYADTFLKDPGARDKNLVVHGYCGGYFSQAVMLAVVADQLPEATSKDVIHALDRVSFKTTMLSSPELAFVDAALKRNGGLIMAWHAVSDSDNDPDGRFDVDDALKLHQRYSSIITANAKPAIPAIPPVAPAAPLPLWDQRFVEASLPVGVTRARPLRIGHGDA